MPSYPFTSSPVGREQLELARVCWRVPKGNRDLFLVVVAVCLCHQTQPKNVTPQLGVYLGCRQARMLCDVFVCTFGMLPLASVSELHSPGCFGMCLAGLQPRNVSLCGIAGCSQELFVCRNPVRCSSAWTAFSLSSNLVWSVETKIDNALRFSLWSCNWC